MVKRIDWPPWSDASQHPAAGRRNLFGKIFWKVLRRDSVYLSRRYGSGGSRKQSVGRRQKARASFGKLSNANRFWIASDERAVPSGRRKWGCANVAGLTIDLTVPSSRSLFSSAGCDVPASRESFVHVGRLLGRKLFRES